MQFRSWIPSLGLFRWCGCSWRLKVVPHFLISPDSCSAYFMSCFRSWLFPVFSRQSFPGSGRLPESPYCETWKLWNVKESCGGSVLKAHPLGMWLACEVAVIKFGYVETPDHLLVVIHIWYFATVRTHSGSLGSSIHVHNPTIQIPFAKEWN